MTDQQYKALGAQYSNKEDGYYEQSRPEMLAFIPEECRFILDVGCSSGAFGELVKRERPDAVVWGIEPNPDASKAAAERLDKVICDTFDPDVPELQDQKFDCIVFNDVLEHLVNPDEALQTAKAYLRKDGSVVASIPNVLHFYNIWQIIRNQDWKYEDSGIMDNTHLRFFTKKSMVRMFERAGFNVAKISGVFPSVGLKYRVANALTLGWLSDAKFVQFGIRSRIEKV